MHRLSLLIWPSVQQNGVTTGYLNKGVNNMVNQGQVKHAEGKERRNLRFADIDGDGRADMLWLDMITGQMSKIILLLFPCTFRS